MLWWLRYSINEQYMFTPLDLEIVCDSEIFQSKKNWPNTTSNVKVETCRMSHDLSLTMSARMEVATMCERRMSATRKSSWYSASRLQTTARRLNMMVCARCLARASLEKMSPVMSDCMNTPTHDWKTSAKNDTRHCG